MTCPTCGSECERDVAWESHRIADTTQAAPIPLNAAQIMAVQEWAADDRLWTTGSVTEFNLYAFARVILKAEATRAEASARS